MYWPKGKRRTVAAGGDSRGCAALSRAASVRAPLVVLVEAQGRGVGARPHGSQRGLKVRTAHALRLQALFERCQRSLAADGLEGERAAGPLSLAAAPRQRRQRCSAGPQAAAALEPTGPPCAGAAVRRCEGAPSRGRWGARGWGARGWGARGWGASLSLPGGRGCALLGGSELGARVAVAPLGEGGERDVGRERHAARVDVQDLRARGRARQRHVHEPVEAAGAQQRGIHQVGPVGGGDHEHRLRRGGSS